MHVGDTELFVLDMGAKKAFVKGVAIFDEVGIADFARTRDVVAVGAVGGIVYSDGEIAIA